jgi:hypothetical protein
MPEMRFGFEPEGKLRPWLLHMQLQAKLQTAFDACCPASSLGEFLRLALPHSTSLLLPRALISRSCSEISNIKLKMKRHMLLQVSKKLASKRFG